MKYITLVSTFLLINMFIPGIGVSSYKDKQNFKNLDPTADSTSVSPVSSFGSGVLEGERIDWYVICTGGLIDCLSPDFLLSSTVGQISSGESSDGSLMLYHGFWQDFGRRCCDTPGDANNDGSCNVGDAVYIINYIYRFNKCDTNSPYGCPPDCMAEGDANYDGTCNVGDVVYIINYIYKFNECITDPPYGCPPECGPEK